MFTNKLAKNLCLSNIRKPMCFELVKNLSQNAVNVSNTFTLEELEIPNGQKYKIACKVWRGETDAKATNIEPPIVCVHGWLDNANSFDALIPKMLQPNRRFYIVDLPGHGLSSHIDNTHYSNHVEAHLAIHRLVRHLKFDKITLLAHSMGAEAAVMFAATRPDLVHKLVTIDGVNPKLPSWVHSVKLFVHSLFETEEVLQKFPQHPLTTYDELLGRMLKARKGMVTEEGCRILLQRGCVEVSEGKFRFTHDLKLRIPPGMALMSTEQMTQFCTALECPVCAIKAGINDQFSDQASKDFQTAMENANCANKLMDIQFHTVEGNHHVHLNHPDLVVPIINKFLDS